MDLKAALAALDAHDPGLLLGQREVQWIDAKAAPYQFADPRAGEELAKDVAAFANGGGGVIVIGVATRLEDDQEVLDHIVGVHPDAVNVDQIRQLIRQRITPAPRGVRIGWSGGNGQRVVFIHVPEQAVGVLCVVAAPTGKPGSEQPHTVAVPIRDGDGTHWLPRAEVQVLLSAQALAKLVREAVADAGAERGLRLGQGLPDRERDVRDAHRQLADAGLGQPAGEAWAHGPAVLQDLDHDRDGEPGWTLCLVADHPPGAVAAPIWQAIMGAGRHAPGHDPLAAVGYPVPPDGQDTPWVIGPDTRSVDLDGGTWGAGRLTCSGRGVWRWEPIPSFSLDQGRSAENWTGGQTPALRLRALVTLPWANPHTLQITKPRRTQLEEQLPFTAVVGAVTMLSRRRGADLPAARWERGASGNSARSVGYACTITAPDGRPALRGSVMLALPTAMNSTVVACADIVIEDPEAWAQALGPHEAARLGFDEVQHVLLSAWETAAEVLPDVVGGDPSGQRWAGPPTTELRITCEQPGPNGALPILDTYIDLKPLGPRDGGGRPLMAVTITASPAMERTRRKELLRRALVHMATQFGYVDAEVEL
ncbi:RNA-binding domain-containing protein [Streptomyces sp. NPDC047072]|uniref:AlbA family DNA-binding domain-containing protein n=1 Tax=Streptomyces sp. NPDC047072 TaxID=3154809 RepID=UPI003411C45A